MICKASVSTAHTWLAMLLLGCQAGPPSLAQELIEFSGATMGTRYHVRAVVSEDASPRQLQERVDRRLVEINRQMSTYDPKSELSRFNRDAAAGEWFEVSVDTAAVVQKSLEIAKATDGAFDPTVGPLVDLWGFGPAGRRREPPADDQIAAAHARVGHRQISVRLDPPALRRSAAEVELDLSAIAKGFAVDEVSHLLAEAGATASMVEIGGEVVARGTKPGDVPWRIGVERPTPQGRAVQTVVELSGALATSGDYRNFFEQGGVRYSHTIDPTTARPVTHSLAAATVCLPSCLEADAVATALLVMGPERALAWCEQYNKKAKQPIGVLLIVREASGKFREEMTPEFRDLVASEKR